MREIQLLAQRCRLSPGDLLHLSREVASDASARIRGPEDLTGEQIKLLAALLRVMASPIDVGVYAFRPPAAA